MYKSTYNSEDNIKLDKINKCNYNMTNISLT